MINFKKPLDLIIFVDKIILIIDKVFAHNIQLYFIVNNNNYNKRMFYSVLSPEYVTKNISRWL